MKKLTFEVFYKKRPNIPKELTVFCRPDTKVALIKTGYAIGISPEPTAKPKSKSLSPL